MFNPAQEREYREVIANWVNAILLFADHLIKNYHVDAPPSPSPPPPSPQSLQSPQSSQYPQSSQSSQSPQSSQSSRPPTAAATSASSFDSDMGAVMGGGVGVDGPRPVIGGGGGEAGGLSWVRVVLITVGIGSAVGAGRVLYLRRLRRVRRLETIDK